MLGTMCRTDEERWFVLNHIPLSQARQSAAEYEMGIFNRISGCNLSLFAPTLVKMVKGGEKLRMREVPLLFHYVFVRGRLDDVRALCAASNGFSLIKDSAGACGYLVISTAAVEVFMQIARMYHNEVPCFSTDEIDLEKGDEVEVVAGDFPGLRGTYIPKRGGRSGNLLIEVTQSLAAVVYDIKADYVRILRFAKGSKRPNDQMDAIVPKLYKAMRTYSAGETLSAAELSPLIVFGRRLGDAKLDTPKLNARLQVILLAISRLLGDREAESRAEEKLARYAPAMTNPATRAFALLCEAVLTRTPSLLSEGCGLLCGHIEEDSKASSIQGISNLSTKETELILEFNHYMSSSLFQLC